MKYISKMFVSAIAIYMFVLSGCENQITSSEYNAESSKMQNQGEIQKGKIPLKLNLKLMPGETYVLNNTNTGFRNIEWLYVEGCSTSDKSIEIIGYADDELMLINCSVSNVALNSVEIINKVKKATEITVYLLGNNRYTVKKQATGF